MSSICGHVKRAGRALNWKTLALVGSLLTLTSARQAHAQATLVTGLGGPEGFGTSCMPPNDDGSWPADSPGLDLTPAFPQGLHFYVGTYTQAWINNNGNLSFQGALSTFTPSAFPGAPEPMIAPYWADVDTRNATECNDANDNYPSAGGYPASATCTSGPDYSSAPATNGVWWSMSPGQLVVTWDQVGYYSCHTTPVMSFQMILSSAACTSGAAGSDFDIEFRYNQCGWEAGDASNGINGFCPAGTPVGTGDNDCTPAQAGFDSAENPDNDYASLPKSLQVGISQELCTQSNLTPPQPGVWQFIVRGGQIQCPQAGQPCVTGLLGVCAAGRLTCGIDGATTCVPLTGPQPAQCNGLDNTCDGGTWGPCPTGMTCDGTSCVPGCGEVGCGEGQVCQHDFCVPAACIGVTCPADKVCQNGACVDPCTGVTCPIGQVCRNGACVYPCEGLNCGAGQVCEDGSCVPTCPCTACTSSQTCMTTGALAGQCVATDCASVTCGAGEVCLSGACISACTGAVCPPGQVCEIGRCVTSDDAGSVVLNLPDAGTISLPDSGVASGGGDGGSGGFVFGASGPAKSGCGCRTTGASERGGLAIGAGFAIAAMIARRRRKR